MAGGTDQSVNLGGMLSGIAETLGSGFQIGGVSAGQALGNNIREAAKPELDMKDPASIREYAQWASRNGKDEEALLMQQKAAEVEAKQGKIKGFMKGQERLANIDKAAAAGDERGFNAGKEGLVADMKTAAQANDFETLQGLQEQFKGMEERENLMKDNQVLNTVQGVSKMRAMLEEGNLTEAQSELLEARVNELLNDPKVATVAAEQAINQNKLTKLEEARVVEEEVAGFFAGTSADTSPEELEELSSKLSGKAQITIQPLVTNMITAYDRRKAREEEAATTGTQLLNEEYVTTLRERISELEEGSKLRIAAEGLIDSAVKDDNRDFAGDTYNGPGGARAAKERMTLLDSRLTSIIIDAASKKDTAATNKRIETEERLEQARLATIVPNETAVNNLMTQYRLADNPITKAAATEMHLKRKKQEYRKLQMESDPERYAEFAAGVERGLNPEWTEEQMSAVMEVLEGSSALPDVEKSLRNAKKIQDPDQREAQLGAIWDRIQEKMETAKNGSIWPVDPNAPVDTTPSANYSNMVVGGLANTGKTIGQFIDGLSAIGRGATGQ